MQLVTSLDIDLIKNIKRTENKDISFLKCFQIKLCLRA